MHLSLMLAMVAIMVTSTVNCFNMMGSMTYFLPVSENIENEECRRDSLSIVQGVKNLELWALKIVDSSAKLPSGVLQGNIKSLGQYDECVETMTNDFSGQYCLASIHLNPLAGAKQREVTTLLDEATLGKLDRESTTNRSWVPLPDLLPSFSLAQLGVCVPSSCTPSDVEVALNEELQRLVEPLGLFTVSAEIPPKACRVLNSGKSFDLAERTMIFVLTLLVILVSIGSALDFMSNNGSEMSVFKLVLLAFSVPRNWVQLTKMENPPPGSFTSLDGIRTLSAFWVIAVHEMHLFTQQAMVDKFMLFESFKNIGNMILTNSTLSVDNFFLIAGMLRAHSLLRDLDTGRFNYFNNTWRRYLRLTPAFAMMVFFYATLLPHISSGPLWFKFAEQYSTACRIAWPSAITYLNNYLQPNSYCMPQTWYLAADMHLFLVAPLLLVPMWRWPRRAMQILFGTLVICVTNTFVSTFTNQSLPTFVMNASDFKLIEYLHIIYTISHHRASVYIVGVALGYVLYSTNFTKLKLSKAAVMTGWITSLTLLCGALFGAYNMIQPGYKYKPLEAALYGALHRPAWALGVAWLVYACHSGYGGHINRFLSARVFQPLSRLSYSIYLTHFILIIIRLGRVKKEAYIDEYDEFREIIVDMMMSVVAALVLHLLVEAPAIELTKIAHSKAKMTSKSVSESASSINHEDKKCHKS